jgi:hypothetical protein
LIYYFDQISRCCCPGGWRMMFSWQNRPSFARSGLGQCAWLGDGVCPVYEHIPPLGPPHERGRPAASAGTDQWCAPVGLSQRGRVRPRVRRRERPRPPGRAPGSTAAASGRLRRRWKKRGSAHCLLGAQQQQQQQRKKKKKKKRDCLMTSRGVLLWVDWLDLVGHTTAWPSLRAARAASSAWET